MVTRHPLTFHLIFSHSVTRWSSGCSHGYLSGALCFIASTNSGEDRQEQGRGEPVPLVLRRRRVCVLGVEVGEQKHDIVRSEHRLVQFKLDL